MSPVRILLLADTHLGFDLPLRPRIQIRRRGEDFFRNYQRALQPALDGEVDVVVHGGDLLYRSRVPPKLVEMAFAPLFRVANRGVPVCLVPGNHERSRIPYPLFAAHRNVHIFDRPRTVNLEVDKLRVALSGFPFYRPGIRDRFLRLLAETRWREVEADLRFLCLHEAVEGARVGPHDYTFRHTPDVVQAVDLPDGFSAILCGHIHRHQVLSHDLAGRTLAAPVFYPGSIERTSFAERGEDKGYLLIEAGSELRFRFVKLPVRPMIDLDLQVDRLGPDTLAARIRQYLSRLDPDAIVRLRLQGRLRPETAMVLRAKALRQLAPASMNLSVYPSWSSGSLDSPRDS